MNCDCFHIKCVGFFMTIFITLSLLLWAMVMITIGDENFNFYQGLIGLIVGIWVNQPRMPIKNRKK